MKKPISLVAALLWIVSSTLIVSGSGYSIMRRFIVDSGRREHPEQNIVKILQRGGEKGALSTQYLAEILSLSIDRPTHVRNFDVGLAERKLRSSPVIEKAAVSVVARNTVVIDYEVRKPVALLYDFVNVALDDQGVPFPLYPFYSPKNLVEIYLGETLPVRWNYPLLHPKMELALRMLKILKLAPFAVKRIDISSAFAESYGQRQIVLLIEECFKTQWQDGEITCIIPRMMRLSTKDYRKDLENYLTLRDGETMVFDPQLATFERERKVARLPVQAIDFRIANMAFLK